jgi:hypothetical protein
MLPTRWPRHDANRADRRHARDGVIACRPIWAATEDMDFVWYFSDVILSASFA